MIAIVWAYQTLAITENGHSRTGHSRSARARCTPVKFSPSISATFSPSTISKTFLLFLPAPSLAPTLTLTHPHSHSIMSYSGDYDIPAKNQKPGLHASQTLSPSPYGSYLGSAPRKYSISGALVNSFQNPSPFDFGGRSYVGMPNRSGSVHHVNSPVVYSGVEVHEQTANLANIGVTEDESAAAAAAAPANIDESFEDYNSSSSSPTVPPPIAIDNDSFHLHDHHRKRSADTNASTTPLLSSTSKKFYTEDSPDAVHPFMHTPDDLEAGTIDYHLTPAGHRPSAGATAANTGPASSKFHHYVVRPVHYLPAVFLGTLLNILDGLSYGMIMFPVSEAVFSSLGPAGLSMFYVLCIVSQLVYSLGGSAFKSGIGSEMIEVTPFFHTMALAINAEMAPRKGSSPDAIIATVIVTYAVLAVVTGLVFFLLGKLRLGALVGFFPRHILVGCIGGVGYFLVVTGIEVSSRLEGGVAYNWPTAKYLFGDFTVFLEWTVPLALTAVLIALQHRVHNSLLVPLFFISVFVVFHAVVAVVPAWSLASARDAGWIFPAVEDNQPWYAFYDLYKFHLVDWWTVVRQFPSMLALTFFGILHVPINVPALAVSVGMDQFDVDRELVAHGYSNALSGLVGSIQNYLVYTNSVLFIRAGADDRLAGVLLAAGTAAVMVAGPVVIGYIPVCVVGSLIYLLGYELLKEAIIDTWGRLKRIEYTTIIIIVVVMGAWDFVYGVLVGILLACLSFVVDAARTPVVRGVYTGVVARSTVLRHPKQQEFLKDVGNQICVIKLQGTVFFGSIGGVEQSIRDRFGNEKFNKNPIKFLILDMNGVSSIDFSAAEGFRRILNLTNDFDTQLIISSVSDDDEVVVALRDAGLWDTDNKLGIQLFSSLNNALEWCENAFLKTYKNIRGTEHRTLSINDSSNRTSSSGRKVSHPYSPAVGNTSESSSANKNFNTRLLLSQAALDGSFATPRTTQVFQAASKTFKDEQTIQNRYYTSLDSVFKKQPLPLLMITFSGLSDKDEEFWSKLMPYLIKEKIPADFTFYDTSNLASTAFFIVESGLIRSVYKFESDKRELHSSILPNTAFGDLYDYPKLGQHYRDLVYTTINDTVAWKLSAAKREELLKTREGVAIYNELLKIQTKLIRERFDTMTANLVLSA